MMVGDTALCALQGIALQKLEITTEGDIACAGSLGSIRLSPPVIAS
jgi:hypothetical protein